MPKMLPPPSPAVPPPAPPDRKRWTRKECEFLVQNHLLTGRYELIDGEIISKMGQKRPHANAVMLLTRWLMRVFGEDRVQCQLPIDVAQEDRETNEPEPDVAVLPAPMTSYTDAHPRDVLLVVEVSDTSLQFDLQIKAAIYARAGIPEYWIADIVNRRIVAHRKPVPLGYDEILEFGQNEEIAPIGHAEYSIRVTDLLPPA